MPAYDYACQKCDYVVEIIHGMTDVIHPKCPHCAIALEKQPSTFNFAFRAGTHTDPVYYGQLARRMPFGKPDPKAWFTSQSAAEDAAKRQCDRTGQTFEKAT